MVLGTHFSLEDFCFLISGAICVIASLALFRNEKITLSIVLLCLGAFLFRFFIIRLDPFLYIWDEQFHALVAKNMLEHPFTPVLYSKPVIPSQPGDWVAGHIWLHKEPFFLWIIALSFKLFGVNEIALRLPSVILSTLMVVMLYRIGKLLVNNKVGYYTAFLFASANYQIEMVTGIVGSDHNDVFFMFLVTGSFWSWFEYKYTGKYYWIYIIGIFSGVAVLVKWLMGLLIFCCWGITVIADKDKRWKFKSYKEILISFLIATLVFSPWVVYSFLCFPIDAVAAYSKFSAHLTTVIENQSGDGFYYLDLIGFQYGWLVPFVLVPAIYYMYKRLKNKKQEGVLLVCLLLIVHVFYAIAKTKMPLFTIISCPVIFLVLGNLFADSIDFMSRTFTKYTNTVIWIVILTVACSSLNPNEIETHHTDTGLMKEIREKHIQNIELYKKLPSIVPSKDFVVFNCKSLDYISAMFYSGLTIYSNTPDSSTYFKLKSDNVHLAVFNDQKLPQFILNDSSTIKLNLSINPFK